MQKVYEKVNKASFKDMTNISFWNEIVEICNDVLENSTNLHERSEAQQYIVRATHIIGKLGGEF